MTTVTACPYPGLRRFDEENAHLFFGREREIAAVIDRLTSSRFLAITGESGCGKSSLIRAGVVSRLQASAVPWRVAILQPGNDPFGNLAREMVHAFASAGSDIDIEIAETVLRSTSRGLLDVIRQERGAAGERLLVVVDQFEEVFRFKRSREGADEDARAFVRLLLTAAGEDAGQVHVIITMRSDYLGDCAQFTGLPEAINGGEYLVPRMTREQMRAAIEGPAAVANTPVAPRLTARILNEVGDDPGELPVVQHALMRTWQVWAGDHAEEEAVEIRHYEIAGTLARALSRHADETLNSLETADLRTAAERLFRALTEVPPGGRPIRRATPLNVLPGITGVAVEQLRTVAMHFAAPGRGFVCYPGDPGPPVSESAVIDITHESLITRWNTLREWVQAEASDVELYRSLARDAELHAEGKRSPWRNPELAVATQWMERRRPTPEWAAQHGRNYDQARAFLTLSQRANQRERRRRQALQWGLLGLVFLAIAAFAWAARQQAETQRLRAQKAVDERDRLQQRIAELTVANPQLGDRAVTLRKENRELQWAILQLQGETQAAAAEITWLKNSAVILQTMLKEATEEQASLAQTIAAEERSAAELKTRLASVQTEEKQVRAEWDRVFDANQELRGKALASGKFVELSPATASMARPSDPQSVTGEAGGEAIPRPPAQGMAGETAKLQFELRELERQNLQLTQSIEELQAENARLRAQESAERDRNAKAKAERDQLAKEYEALTTSWQRAKAQVAASRDKLRKAQSARRDARFEVESAQWRIAAMRRSIGRTQTENKMIERMLRER